MTRSERIRFRDFIFEALLVRSDDISVEVAEERANNISMGVDADFDVRLKDEDPTPSGRDLHEESPDQLAERYIK